jgi:hypothetical protein
VKDERKEHKDHVTGKRERVVANVREDVGMFGGLRTMGPLLGNPTMRNEHEGNHQEKDSEGKCKDQFKSHHNPEEPK